MQSHAYHAACAALGLHATEKACPLLVPLVEEGWIDHPVTREVIRIYLTEALADVHARAASSSAAPTTRSSHAAIDATLRSLDSHAVVIDSAAGHRRRRRPHPRPHFPLSHNLTSTPSTFQCFATDSVEKFQRLGSHFLGQPIPEVHLLDLGG